MSTINPPASSRDTTGQTRTQPTESERAAAAAMLPMIWGMHISRAVYVAAELRIADLLADGPVSCAELARATRTHEPSLYRVLRLLAALGVLDTVGSQSFGLTALGDRLRSDAPACVRSWAIFLEALGGVRPFEHILHTVRTGEPGFDTALGMKIFDFLAQNPQNAATFDAAMSERTAAFAPSVADACDFSHARIVVDVGGGQGPCWWRSCGGTRTCRASCSRPRPSQPVPTRYSTRPTSRIGARCWRETSSRTFRTAQTTTCWRMSCTTGTTRKRGRSCATAA